MQASLEPNLKLKSLKEICLEISVQKQKISQQLWHQIQTSLEPNLKPKSLKKVYLEMLEQKLKNRNLREHL